MPNRMPNKRFFLALCLLIAPLVASADYYRPDSVLQLSLRVNGTPIPLGCISSADGASYNNHTTSGGGCSAFNNTGIALEGKTLLVYAAAGGRVLPGTLNTASTVATAGAATAGVPLKAGERAIIVMTNTHGWLAWKPDASGNSLEVWELQ